MKETLVKHLKRVFYVFVVVKTLMSVQNVIHPKPAPRHVEVTHDIDSLYDLQSDTFRLIDQPNASFLQVPRWACDKDTKIVVTVLTALKNFEQRDQLRQLVKEVDEVSVLFLLGNTYSVDVHNLVRSENEIHGDILQGSTVDSYRTLAYKTLMGFVWVNRFCSQARYIVKLDDDVQLDLPRLTSVLNRKYGQTSEYGDRPPDVVECPSVMRNMRPWRHNHSHTIMGKWSVSREEMSRRVFPDFCPGWLYVTTPKVGLGLAEIAWKSRDLIPVARLDDIFVTGFLLERLAGVSLQQLNNGLTGFSWNHFFSHCPFLGITKNIFYNDIVLDKGSGSVTYIKGQKFYWCAFLEFFILENIEYLAPELSPNYLWDMCSR